MTKTVRDRDFSYEIKEHIGVIKVHQTGWKRELNLVSWNGTQEKLDLRDWDPEHQHMGRGITLHRWEAEKLTAMLDRYLCEGITGEGEDESTDAAALDIAK